MKIANKHVKLIISVLPLIALMCAACSSSSKTRSATTAASSGSTSTQVTNANGHNIAAAEALAQTDQATTSAQTMHITVNSTATVSLPGAGSGQQGASNVSETISGSGDLNATTKVAVYHFSLSSSSLAVPSTSFDEIMAGNTFYISSDLFINLPQVNKPWVSVTAGEPAGSNTLEDAFANPTAMLGILSNLGTVTTVGSAVIDGTQTTEYKVNIDVAKAVVESSDTGIAAALKCLNMTSFPLAIWIDAQGRTRQIQFTWNLSQSSASVTVSVTIGFSTFGEPVYGSAPSPSDV